MAEGLRRELRELGARQGYTHTELHQARLQVAQLTLQLTEEDLLLREERANWALEREAYKHGAEVSADCRSTTIFQPGGFNLSFSWWRAIRRRYRSWAARCRGRRSGFRRRGGRGRS